MPDSKDPDPASEWFSLVQQWEETVGELRRHAAETGEPTEEKRTQQEAAITRLKSIKSRMDATIRHARASRDPEPRSLNVAVLKTAGRRGTAS